MATKTLRHKARPSRRTRHSKDDSDVYAALNDFTAIEAMPNELVRQFTLLREVDAKYSGIPAHIISKRRSAE
jgi:Inhibitor of growth proteins N-terminal histone-binding